MEPIWYCNAADASQVLGFHWPEGLYDTNESIRRSDLHQIAVRRAFPLPVEFMPDVLETTHKSIRKEGHRAASSLTKLPHYVRWTNHIVSEEVANILKDHRLGLTELHPVSLKRADRDQPFDQRFLILSVGVSRKTLVRNGSGFINEIGPRKTLRIRSGRVAKGATVIPLADYDLTVYAAENWHWDLWTDTRISGSSLFLTNRLAKALIENNLAEDLDLYRCKVRPEKSILKRLSDKLAFWRASK